MLHSLPCIDTPKCKNRTFNGGFALIVQCREECRYGERSFIRFFLLILLHIFYVKINIESVFILIALTLA
jgi:hypothetical protein